MARQIAVSLHLGAHKTASTHLQKSIERNSKLLDKHGCRFLGPKFLRHKDHAFLDLFGLRPDGRTTADRSGPEQLEWLANGARKVVLADENILGPTFARLNPGVLYPQADIRVESFVRAVHPSPVTVFIATREPAKWLASLYSQRIVGGDVKPFEEFLSGNQPDQLRWSNLIDRLRKVPGLAGLYTWRKEDYPEVAAPVLRRMIGWRVGPLIERIEGRVNEGLSEAAITQLVQWGADGREGQPKEWAKEARKLFSVSDAFKAFDPWDEDTKARSKTAYAADLALMSGWDDIEIVKPSRRSRG